MKKKKEEQAENPLHREYGILSNIRYCFQNIRKYKPILILFIVIGMAANSFMQVLGSFARKYVIDLVMLQAESTDKDILRSGDCAGRHFFKADCFRAGRDNGKV
ncbi:MAG: hypothetical protein K2G16_04440 [Lachnospiraceae bacterium]|nr:hypothetical protein [Lachnospiraceae bacterium]